MYYIPEKNPMVNNFLKHTYSFWKAYFKGHEEYVAFLSAFNRNLKDAKGWSLHAIIAQTAICMILHFPVTNHLQGEKLLFTIMNFRNTITVRVFGVFLYENLHFKKIKLKLV